MEERIEPPEFPMARTCPHLPPPGYQGLRDQGPLARVRLFDGRSAWIVTGHALARTLLVHPDISSDHRNPRFPALSPGRRVLQSRKWLIGMDAPEHTTHRKRLIPAFTLKRINRLRPGIQDLVDRLIDEILAKGSPAELMERFALPVPSVVICQILGVPYEDHAFFEGEAAKLVTPGTPPEEMGAALSRLDAYLHELVERKRRAPGEGDGLLDELITDHLEHGDATPEEIVSSSLMLLVAGHETTANMISLGLLVLLDNPEQLTRVRENPELIPQAVEELLRFISTADILSRVAKRDIEAEGHVIREGEGVFFANAAINRDERWFDRADTVDIHRDARGHTAFGYGVHQCLGQNLARAELEIALETLLRRIPTIELAESVDQLPVKGASGPQGVFTLPVRW
ncbi:cytochrome P450 [Nocardiopsis exhalans]|uniref:Cytochrome P450 n=1 Tax=Nocardiopsis exhalans TaxID=163604 RepID=A0ABY5D687_9ACTN|nr:cytochrome P450 [Nocardiopsis exhalans]USY18410.1 cytochrome P450 [Nocardiopsis exhalans]